MKGIIIGTNCDTHTYFAKSIRMQYTLFLEKPVGVTIEDLKVLQGCLKVTTALIVISCLLRVTQLVQEIKKLLDSNVIGKVGHVQAFNNVLAMLEVKPFI